MTRDLENDGSGDLIESADVPSEKSEDVDRLDDLLGILQPNTTIVIERLQPTWCCGFLEEVTLSEQIGLEYFIENWGGHLLSVKVRGKRGRFSNGSYKVPLYTYPPLRWGEPLRLHNKNERFKDDDEKQMAGVAAPSAPVVVNPSNPFEKLFSALPTVLPLLLEYWKNQEAKRQNELQMMMQMVRSNSGGGLSDITKVGAVMGQLQQMFQSQGNGGGGGGGELDFLPHALDVLKMVMSPGAPAPGATAPGAPASGAPAPGAPALRPPKKASPPGTVAQNANVTQLESFRDRDLSDDLSQLDPNDCIDTVLDALDKMPDDKRGATIANFIQVYQDDMKGELEALLTGGEEKK